MRVVIQRTKEASVTVEGVVTGAIQKGLMVLVGIENADSAEDIEWLAGKIVNMRIFDDAHGVMNLSLKEVGGDLLLVSQFTLHASTKKGNRPSYIAAAKPDVAIPLYEAFIKQLQLELGKTIATGIFGADMKVQLLNDGPVTILVDTKNKEAKRSQLGFDNQGNLWLGNEKINSKDPEALNKIKSHLIEFKSKPLEENT
ncbi:MAG: D-tyrosyl-tRNA(Tyr) deacylase, partial [Chitinophagia bacterium]|nr:D-tyrosyl-tRNA(Tyr) deacylase [Chitinophagia bacterium]